MCSLQIRYLISQCQYGHYDITIIVLALRGGRFGESSVGTAFRAKIPWLIRKQELWNSTQTPTSATSFALFCFEALGGLTLIVAIRELIISLATLGPSHHRSHVQLEVETTCCTVCDLHLHVLKRTRFTTSSSACIRIRLRR